MGGRSSKSRRPNGPNRNFSHGQTSHGRYANYTDNYVPPSTVNRKYSQIGDEFVSLDQVIHSSSSSGEICIILFLPKCLFLFAFHKEMQKYMHLLVVGNWEWR